MLRASSTGRHFSIVETKTFDEAFFSECAWIAFFRSRVKSREIHAKCSVSRSWCAHGISLMVTQSRNVGVKPGNSGELVFAGIMRLREWRYSKCV